jgi:clan AA aspartic protease
MISGSVNSRQEAVVSLSVKGPDGQSAACDVVVDTGFNGPLALPPQVISALGLPKVGVMRALLGDGNETTLDLHEAVVVWDGKERSVEAECVGSDAFIGTSLLAGYQLRISFITHGAVEVPRLP